MDKEDVAHLYNGIFSSVQFSHSVVSDSLQHHGLQHTRLPYPSPTPRAYSNSSILPLGACSVPQSCPTLCDSMDCSTPGFPVHHQLPELTQTHVYQIGDAIQPSSSVVHFSSCHQSFPASGSLPMSQFFTSGGQSTGVSALLWHCLSLGLE